MDGSRTFWGNCETFGTGSPNWCDTCCDAINKLSELEENWDSYGAKPVDRDSIQAAILFTQIISQIDGIQCPRVAASPGGCVALTWEWDDFNQELDIHFDVNDSFRYSYINERQPKRDCEGDINNLIKLAVILTTGYVGK